MATLIGSGCGGGTCSREMVLHLNVLKLSSDNRMKQYKWSVVSIVLATSGHSIGILAMISHVKEAHGNKQSTLPHLSAWPLSMSGSPFMAFSSQGLSMAGKLSTSLERV